MPVSFVCFCCMLITCVFVCFRFTPSPEGDTNITPPRQPSASAGDGDQESSSAPAAIHRWPLRPGVHVHVNGARNLAIRDPTSTPTSSTSSTTNFIRASTQYSAMPSGTVGSRKRTLQKREQMGTATVFPAPSNINNNSISAANATLSSGGNLE
jgi:hypothetical protein